MVLSKYASDLSNQDVSLEIYDGFIKFTSMLEKGPPTFYSLLHLPFWRHNTLLQCCLFSNIQGDPYKMITSNLNHSVSLHNRKFFCKTLGRLVD